MAVPAKAFNDAYLSREKVARYFGVAPEIAHLVPELLVDFYDLGSFPERIVELLRAQELEPGARVLDLGCGKGAVALSVAKQLRASVEGVDMMSTFIEEAKERAERAGLAESCRFTCGDIRQRLGNLNTWSEAFDVVLFLSVGEVLGNLAASIKILRQVVRKGGYIVIDDGYIKEGVTVDFPGYEQSLDRQQCLDQLTSFGDRIVVEEAIPLTAIREQNKRFMAWIENRAQEIAARYPEHTAALASYLEKERVEVHLLENDFECVTWLLERRD